MPLQLCHILLPIIFFSLVSAYFNAKNFDCGPFGFVCESKSRLRLCADTSFVGPAFLCPSGTICNDDSSDVCESKVNYIDPILRTVRCHRNERIADPTVPDCKGYILCIPNNNRFQGIKFKCSGDTVFNGFSRTCSSKSTYKCPLNNTTKTSVELFDHAPDRIGYEGVKENFDHLPSRQKVRPIDCKNYKLTVTQDKSPARAAYFCPPRPTSYGAPTKCTVFSNNFCLILEKDNEDQFTHPAGVGYRRPRTEASMNPPN